MGMNEMSEQVLENTDADLNKISLEQALIDFEVANARVIDLTGRLTSLTKELLSLRAEYEIERTSAALSTHEHKSYREKNDYLLAALRESRAIKLTSMVAPRLRNALNLSR